mmetsp:Transcript_45761/g.93654  ORF Transcript_45761/g.93654 Transcript_45761/m.93654 type:complete len:203 (-) Transcript_45761:382-990(-)
MNTPHPHVSVPRLRAKRWSQTKILSSWGASTPSCPRAKMLRTGSLSASSARCFLHGVVSSTLRCLPRIGLLRWPPSPSLLVWLVSRLFSVAVSLRSLLWRPTSPSHSVLVCLLSVTVCLVSLRLRRSASPSHSVLVCILSCFFSITVCLSRLLWRSASPSPSLDWLSVGVCLTGLRLALAFGSFGFLRLAFLDINSLFVDGH